MIFSVFISLGAGLLATIVAFLPSSTGLSPRVMEGMDGLLQYLYVFDKMIAIDVLWFSIGILMTFELIVIGFHMIRWVIGMIPFMRV